MGRVLLVHRDQHVRRALCRLLERDAWYATGAATDLEAQHRLREFQFEAVLVDVDARVSAGLDVLRTAASVAPAMRRLASVTDAAEADAARLAGAEHLIWTPIEYGDVAQQLARTWAR